MSKPVCMVRLLGKETQSGYTVRLLGAATWSDCRVRLRGKAAWSGGASLS